MSTTRLIPKALLLCSIFSILTDVSEAFSPDHAKKVVLGIRDNERNISDSVIPFASAVSLEAAVTSQLATLSSVQPVPVPTGTDEAKKLGQGRLSTLVKLLPPIQTTKSGGSQDFDSMLAQLTPDPPVDAMSSTKIRSRQGSLNIMIVGDSISHGQEGDWTWRYRIWQWLKSQNVAFNFVGPYKGTQEPATKNPGPPQAPPLYGQNASSPSGVRANGGYSADCDTGFVQNSQHFSVFGRAAATDVYLIADMVRQYPTDLMLLMLGFNDLGWFYSDASGTIKSIATMIKNARSVNPNMKFAVANVVQRTDLGRNDLIQNTDLYNSYLKQEIPKWTTTQSPVVLVDVQSRYTCGPNIPCTAAYDGLHPNSLGEFQIASAFADGLINGLKIGQTPLAVPSSPPRRSTPVPSNFKVYSSPQGVTATWDAVYGAYGYDVQTRFSGQDWSTGSVMYNRFDLQWAIDNTTYEVRVRTRGGDFINGDWTSIGTGDTSKAQTSRPPDTLTTHSTSDGFQVSWSTPQGRGSDTIVEYNILYFDLTDNCGFLIGAAFKNSPATITGLIPGHRYLVGIEVWNAAGEGLPSVGFDIKVGARHSPAAPNNLQIQAIDATSAYFTWDSVSEAAGYRIWRAYQDNAPVQYNGSVSIPCSNDFFLFPGVQNYKYCVNSINGNDEGPRGPCVRAPPANGNKQLSCPPAPGYCPGGGGKFGPAPETPGSPPDVDAGGSGNTGNVPGGSSTAGASSTDIFLDTVIYQGKPTASCVAPCNFIIPPLPYSTVLTPPLWTTSFQYAYPTTTTVTGGSTRTLYYITVITTTITLPAVTRTAIEVWNFNYTLTQSTKYGLTESIILPPITISKPSPPPGVTTIPHPLTTRTITPPLFTNPTATSRPVLTILPVTIGGDSGGGGGGGGGPKCRTDCGGHKCLLRCGTNSGCGNPFGCPGADNFGTDGFNDPERNPDDNQSCTTTKTASICTYSLSYGTNSQGSTTTTSTSTRCSTTLGCTVSGSSTTITPTSTPGPPKPYSVYPKTQGDTAQADRINQKLLSYANGDSSKIDTVAFPDNSPILWAISLTDDQVAELKTNADVSEVVQECGCRSGRRALRHRPPQLVEPDVAALQSSENHTIVHEKRDLYGGFQFQNCPDDWSLPYVSLQPGKALSDAANTYVYHNSAGAGQYIYVWEDGINVNDPELKAAYQAGRLTVISADKQVSMSRINAANAQDPDYVSDTAMHGTQMVQKMIGSTLGVAPMANVVLVHAIPLSILPPNSGSVSELSRAFTQACTHFSKLGSNKPTNGVINMSQVVELFTVAEAAGITRAVQTCEDMGVMTVVASGNDGNTVPIAGQPQQQSPRIGGRIRSLVLVGAIDVNGDSPSFSQGDDNTVDLYAPGANVRYLDPSGKYRNDGWGTSFSCATTSGMAAYLLNRGNADPNQDVADNPSAGQLPRQRLYTIRDKLVNTFGGQKGSRQHARNIWNGVNGVDKVNQRNCAQLPGSPPKGKRQAGAACTPSGNNGGSGTTASPSPSGSGGGSQPPPATTTEDNAGRPCATSAGAASCTPLPPATPSQTSSNHDGSSNCVDPTYKIADNCKTAAMRYVRDRLYKAYTSYTDQSSGHNYGCTAIFQCDNNDAYNTGMWGWQIQDAFSDFYRNNTDTHNCGSVYFSNNCHITANYCSGCKDQGT